jgi:hypothetical protein
LCKVILSREEERRRPKKEKGLAFIINKSPRLIDFKMYQKMAL